MNVRLREARKAAGYTQQKLADTVGVSRSTVAMWESGTDCGVEMVAKLSKTLGVSSGYLLGEVGDPRREPERGVKMTDAEYALSMRIRNLSEKGKRDVMNFISFTESLENQNKE